jgi:chromosome segregation ATPase
LGELEAWRNDCEEALSREINDLRNEIKLKQGQMTANVGSLTFQQIVDLQEEINKLNEVIVQKQRQMLKNKDEIKKAPLTCKPKPSGNCMARPNSRIF